MVSRRAKGKPSFYRAFLLAAVGVVLLAAPSIAQTSSSTGSIQGTVTDQSGAVVPGAKVTAVNEGTGVRTEGSTQSDGTYIFPFVLPGSYRVEVESPSFRRVVLGDIRVEVSKATVANARLELGEVTSEIIVSSSAQLVDTTSATTGEVISSELVRNIPLATRNSLDLLGLQAGVAVSLNSPAAIGRGIPTLFVAGQRGTTNNYVLNGVDANNYGNNNFGNVPVPNPDATREFRVSTSQYDASQGRGSGGNINLVIQSGEQQFHGNAFWFYREDDLNANDFFFNKAGTPKPTYLQNQFGGSIGGPVPGLDETFWFFNYQGMRQKNGVSGAVTGSFPVLPATRDAASLEAAFGLAPGSIDPVAVAWLNQPGQFGGFSVPSGTGAAVGQTGLFAFSAPSFFDEDQFSASFDHQLLRDNKVAVRFFFSDTEQTNPIGGGVSLGQGQRSPLKNTHAAVSDIHTFTPFLFNEFRAGFTLVEQAQTPVENVTLNSIGMSRFNSAFFQGTPGVFVSGLLSFGGINTNNDQASANLAYTIGDTLSWTRGKHTVRGGVEFRRYHVNLFNNFASRGALVFLDFDDFLTGTPFQTFIGSGVTDRGFRAWDLSWFVQDDYRILPRLTLNLGLRYDLLQNSIDIRDRIGNFDPNLVSSSCITAGGGACLQAGFIAPQGLGGGFGTPGVRSSTMLGVDRNNFSPRIGLAYDVFGNGKLAIRSGYGIYYIRTSNQTLLQLITGAPFFQLSNLVNFPVGSGALANPFPALATPDQFPILPTFPQFNGFSAAGSPLFVDPATGNPAPLLTLNPFERNMATPYTQNWNLTVQYEFLKNWVAEVGYIGSRGVKLLRSTQANSARLVNAASPGLGGLTVNSSLNANARTLIPGFSTNGLNMVTGSGESWYNAFIASVRRPLTRGLDVRFNYTFSKSLDNNSGTFTQDLGNSLGNQLVPDLNKGLSNFDQRHRFVFTYLWQIPGPVHGILNRVLGGWSLSGTTILQSGFPFSVVTNTGGSLQGVSSGTARADVSCNAGLTATGNISNRVDNFLTANCFAAPPTLPVGTVLTGLNSLQAPGTGTFTIGNLGASTTGGSLFGNSGRNILRGPFQQRFDVALVKSFALDPLYSYLGEAASLQFRSEFFNLFNTPIFNNPNGNVQSAAFGRITSTNDTTGRVIQFALKLNF